MESNETISKQTMVFRWEYVRRVVAEDQRRKMRTAVKMIAEGEIPLDYIFHEVDFQRAMARTLNAVLTEASRDYIISVMKDGPIEEPST